MLDGILVESGRGTIDVGKPEQAEWVAEGNTICAED